MNFTYSAEQIEFRDVLHALLQAEVGAERIRARWDTASGRDAALEAQLRDFGLYSLMFPESLDGLGLSVIDCALLAEVCGRAALPEPAVETMMVASPLLVDVLDRGLGNGSVQAVIEGVMSGDARVAVSHAINPHVNFVEDAHWVIVGVADAIYLLPRDKVEVTPLKSVDPSRRIAKIDFDPEEQYRLVEGEAAAAVLRSTLNRGALSVAAQLVGLSEVLVEQSVRYAADREQFGRAIGVNQAIKHHLADVAVQIEYARPVIARAAYTLSVSPERADIAVSHAKLAAARVGLLAARHGIQVHGAMGYTWECNVHIWSKRIWALVREWGDEGFHKNRLQQWLLQSNALLGPEFTFGRRSLLPDSRVSDPVSADTAA